VVQRISAERRHVLVAAQSSCVAARLMTSATSSGRSQSSTSVFEPHPGSNMGALARRQNLEIAFALTCPRRVGI
jgi:hypothetical protein